jgi:hypothetical protein
MRWKMMLNVNDGLYICALYFRECPRDFELRKVPFIYLKHSQVKAIEYKCYILY